MLFGVFDGHAGSACAQAVSERLFYYIAVSLLPLKTLTEIEEAVESEWPVLPVLQWHKHPNDYVSTQHRCNVATSSDTSSLTTFLSSVGSVAAFWIK